MSNKIKLGLRLIFIAFVIVAFYEFISLTFPLVRGNYNNSSVIFGNDLPV